MKLLSGPSSFQGSWLACRHLVWSYYSRAWQFLHDLNVRSAPFSNVESVCRRVCQPMCFVIPASTAAGRMLRCRIIIRLLGSLFAWSAGWQRSSRPAGCREPTFSTSAILPSLRDRAGPVSARLRSCIRPRFDEENQSLSTEHQTGQGPNWDLISQSGCPLSSRQ